MELVELHGTYLNAAADPAEPGTVTITPDVVATNGLAVIVQQPVVTEVDDDGTFTVEVVASNDPAWGLVGESMPYIITENVPGNHRAFMAYIDGPGPVDITDLVPLSEAPEFPTIDAADYQLRDEKDTPDGYVGLDVLGAIDNPILSGIVGMPTLPVNTAGDYGASCDYVIAEADYLVGVHATGPQHPFIPQFSFAKVEAVLDIPDTWTEVNRLGTDVVAGTYMFGVSLTWAFDVTNRSAEFRLSTDNGQTWGQTYHIEPTDAQDIVPFLYQYPVDYSSAQPVGVILEARKTADTGTLDVTFCDLYLQRVG